MPTRIAVFVAIVATVVTGIAGAATRDPMKLALQRSDMPSTTDPAPSWAPSPARDDAATLAPLGVKGLKGAFYKYTWPGVSETKKWALSGNVFVAPSQSKARELFARGKRTGVGFVAAFPYEYAKLSFRTRFGDEQLGAFASDPTVGPQAMMFVRRGSVVWQMRVETARNWKLTKAQVVGVLTKYALKQKRRIGSG